MTTQFIVVRHGETEWNQLGIQQGQLDSPLSSKGILQAKNVANAIEGESIAASFCSDLGRAIETCSIITKKLAIDFTTSNLLRERNLGIMQGMTRTDFESQHPDAMDQFLSHTPDYQLPQGESRQDVYSRCCLFLEKLAHQYPEKQLLIVTHSGVLTELFYKAVGLPLNQPRQFSLMNASINRFIIDQGQWQLNSWGETSHHRGMAIMDAE